MEKIISACFALAMIFSSCNNSTPAANPQLSSSQKKETGEKKNRDKDTAKILNDISVQTESGVEVDKAFLSYEDGSLVPSPNLTSLNKPIYLNLNIAKGWVEEMGESSLGISEKIVTDAGTLILNEPDLFKNYISFSAEDAKFLRLKAVIKSMKGPIRYFIVEYKAWDKKGNGVIRGSYKFYIE